MEIEEEVIASRVSSSYQRRRSEETGDPGSVWRDDTREPQGGPTPRHSDIKMETQYAGRHRRGTSVN